VCRALIQGRCKTSRRRTSATGISSDYEHAQVLTAAAKIVKEEEVRTRVVEVARGIRSDYERGNLLSAAIK
jgi:hypothetical protein